MTNKLPTDYLSVKELVKKLSFLTDNMMKNLLYKNIDGIKDKLVRRLGRKMYISEKAFLEFIENNRETSLSPPGCGKGVNSKNLKKENK